MNEIEGIGEVVTGGLVARAVEPETGEDGHTHESACLNCGAPLAGPYCHVCGQHAHVHRTLHAFGHDLLHGVLHFEGKIWRTLPLLAWKPGELTRRYIEGERARFVSPIALFLFSVFLMFAVFGTIGGPFGDAAAIQASAQGGEGVQRRLAAVDGRIAGLERERQAQAQARQSTAAVDGRIEAARRERQALATATRFVGAAVPAAGEGNEIVDVSDLTIDTPWPWLNQAVEHVKENPSLFAYKLQTSAYKFSWAVIPISVPFVWLLFAGQRRYKAYDHTVFVTYSLAFVTLLLIVLSLIRAAGLNGFNPQIFTIVTPIHMFRQLRGAYDLGVAGALWRTIFLLFFALLASTLFVALLLTMGLLG